MQITPNASLFTALAQLAGGAQAKSAQAADLQEQQARRTAEEDPRRQALIDEFRAQRSNRQRLSTPEELDEARERLNQQDNQSQFRREAPTNGIASQQQAVAQPGTIIDILV